MFSLITEKERKKIRELYKCGDLSDGAIIKSGVNIKTIETDLNFILNSAHGAIKLDKEFI